MILQYPILELHALYTVRAFYYVSFLYFFNIVLITFVLQRIISNLKKRPEYLQKDALTLSDAYARVQSTKTTLQQTLDK